MFDTLFPKPFCVGDATLCCVQPRFSVPVTPALHDMVTEQSGDAIDSKSLGPDARCVASQKPLCRILTGGSGCRVCCLRVLPVETLQAGALETLQPNSRVSA